MYCIFSLVIEAFLFLSRKTKSSPAPPPAPVQNRKRSLPFELNDRSAQPPQRLLITAPVGQHVTPSTITFNSEIPTTLAVTSVASAVNATSSSIMAPETGQENSVEFFVERINSNETDQTQGTSYSSKAASNHIFHYITTVINDKWISKLI